MLDIAQKLSRWLEETREFAVATVVRVSGSAPRRLGAALAMDRDGNAIGSASGGCAEGAVHDLCACAPGRGWECRRTGRLQRRGLRATANRLTTPGRRPSRHTTQPSSSLATYGDDADTSANAHLTVTAQPGAGTPRPLIAPLLRARQARMPPQSVEEGSAVIDGQRVPLAIDVHRDGPGRRRRRWTRDHSPVSVPGTRRCSDSTGRRIRGASGVECRVDKRPRDGAITGGTVIGHSHQPHRAGYGAT